ncbi:MAG: DUF3352 domain-containing protein [Chloroflexi bacterium]|nr:DUF3352 domain-containing protein [Chloroflexota bacterium]
MSDDPTRPIDTPSEPPMDAPATEQSPAPPPPPAAEPAAAPGATGDVAPVAMGAPMAAAAPVAAPGAAGGNRTRWAIAGVVAGLAIALTIGAVLLFGQQAVPSALQYVPGDAAVVAEIRLDLPGDQLQRVGNLLAHFPGFADQSTLTAKLDEALAKFVSSASQGKASYTTDLKPWVNGPLFIAALNPSDNVAGEGLKDTVISATTNGAVACATVFKDQTVKHETYRALDLVLSADGAMGCVIDGRQALLGDPATVRKAIDAKAAGSGMDRSAEYKAARTALGGDRLATLYMNGASLTKLMPTPSSLPVAGLENVIGGLPSWLMAGVRAEDDAFVVDYVAAPVPAATGGPSLLPVPGVHASVLAPMVPGDTLVFVEAQGAGVSLQNLLIQLRTIPDVANALNALDGLGGAGELVSWVDDAGVAVSTHGTVPDAAVLLVARDEAAVTSRVASLKTLLALMGPSSGITVKDATVNGVAVTTVTISDLGKLVPQGTVPGMTSLPSGPISFSIAARGKVLLVTSGEGAMTAILNTAAGNSLADDAAFKHAGTRGIANARTTIYVGVGASINLLKGFLTADQLATYQKDAAPYVEPFEGFLLQATSDAAGNRSRMVITVTQK